MKKILNCLTLLSTLAVSHAADSIILKSPDHHVVLRVQAGSHLSYDVRFNGAPVVELSAMGITLDGNDLGRNVMLTGKPQKQEFSESYPTLGVHAIATNHYESATVPISGGSPPVAWQLELRAYDDGVAYRYRVAESGRHLLNGESSSWQLPVETMIWHQSADNRSYEARYVNDIVGQMGLKQRIMAPAALKFPNGAGYGLMTEANLVNYSDMSLCSAGAQGFKATFQDDPDGWEQEGEVVSPWRVTIVAKDLNGLVNSDLIKNLCPAPSAELAKADWIKPGRSVWHWLTGGSPKLDEQKNWVDGTRQLSYEYYLVDDGWRDWKGGGDNAWQALAELVSYAKSQNVAVWAWVNSRYVFEPSEREAYFKRAKSIGLAGLKIDFPRPPSAKWVQWYEDTLRDAAKVQLMVDFHGAVKPTGRERTWPNEITREAIAGREQGKSPSLHDITLPFLRYVQGHADFTPTLLIPRRLNGSSYAHELSMAVIFTSPFLCMGDNPTNYLQSEAADVIKALPAVWDETRVLPSSEIGQLAIFARRHGNQWFIGALNDLTPRRESVALTFLGSGNYKLVELADSPERNDAFVRSERQVMRADRLTLPLRKDGGYVAWLVPVEQR